MRSGFQLRSLMLVNGIRYVYPDGQAFIVNTPGELSAATGPTAEPPTPASVFATWGRYAGPDWYPSGSTPAGEATSWIYDSGTNQIRSTINSVNYIGFVSPEELSYYELTTRLGSGNTDDDLIGVVIAFVMDGTTPTTICAVRSNGGSIGGTTWAIVQIAANTPTVLTNGSSFAPTTFTNPGGTGWQGSGQTVVRVKRDNRTITATCSQFGSGTLDPATEITYDIPTGSIFDDTCSYGFMCQSQNDAHYDTLGFTGGLDQSTVYDITSSPPKVYEYTGSTWVHNPARSVFTELGQPRKITNPSTGKSYYLDNNTVTILP